MIADPRYAPARSGLQRAIGQARRTVGDYRMDLAMVSMRSDGSQQAPAVAIGTMTNDSVSAVGAMVLLAGVSVITYVLGRVATRQLTLPSADALRRALAQVDQAAEQARRDLGVSPVAPPQSVPTIAAAATLVASTAQVTPERAGNVRSIPRAIRRVDPNCRDQLGLRFAGPDLMYERVRELMRSILDQSLPFYFGNRRVTREAVNQQANAAVMTIVHQPTSCVLAYAEGTHSPDVRRGARHGEELCLEQLQIWRSTVGLAFARNECAIYVCSRSEPCRRCRPQIEAFAAREPRLVPIIMYFRGLRAESPRT